MIYKVNPQSNFWYVLLTSPKIRLSFALFCIALSRIGQIYFDISFAYSMSFALIFIIDFILMFIVGSDMIKIDEKHFAKVAGMEMTLDSGLYIYKPKSWFDNCPKITYYPKQLRIQYTKLIGNDYYVKTNVKITPLNEDYYVNFYNSYDILLHGYLKNIEENIDHEWYPSLFFNTFSPNQFTFDFEKDSFVLNEKDMTDIFKHQYALIKGLI